MEIRKVSVNESEKSYTLESYELVVGGDVVGWAQVMVDEESAYLERVDIEDGFQGQGYGTKFIKELSSEYGSIIAAPDNARCKRLMERLGDDVSDEQWAVDQGFGVYEI